MNRKPLVILLGLLAVSLLILSLWISNMDKKVGNINTTAPSTNEIDDSTDTPDPEEQITNDPSDEPPNNEENDPQEQGPYLTGEGLFGLLNNNDINIVSVFDPDLDLSRNYESDHQMFFSSTNSSIRFVINIPKGKQVRAEEYERFLEGIKVIQAQSGDPISMKAFDNNDHDIMSDVLSIMIQLEDAPQDHLIIQFHTPEAKKEFRLIYSEPFHYQVTSPANENVESYFSWTRTGGEYPLYLPYGQHTFDLTFSLDVDRSMIHSRIEQGLRDVQWTTEWSSDRKLQLQVDLTEEHEGERFTIDMNMIKAKLGIAMRGQNHLLIIPSSAKEYQWMDLQTNETEQLLSTIVPYRTFYVSPNGRWVLAEEIEDANYVVGKYSLLDIDGELIANFEPGEVKIPQWLPQRNSLLYVQDNKLVEYEVETGLRNTIWTSPEEGYHSRIVSLSVDPDSGKIAVGSTVPTIMELAEYTTFELYIFDDITDEEPQVIDELLYFVCMDGPCFSTAKFTSPNKLVYFTRDPDPANEAQIYQASSEYKILDLYSLESGIIRSIGYKESNTINPIFGRGRVYFVHQTSTKSTKWTMFDTSTYQTREWTETNPEYYHYGTTVISFENEQDVLHIPNEGIYELKADTLQLKPHPVNLVKGKYVGAYGSRLIFRDE